MPLERKRAFLKSKAYSRAGFYTHKNMEIVFKEDLDAYIVGGNFRKRDPKFQDRDC